MTVHCRTDSMLYAGKTSANQNIFTHALLSPPPPTHPPTQGIALKGDLVLASGQVFCGIWWQPAGLLSRKEVGLHRTQSVPVLCVPLLHRPAHSPSHAHMRDCHVVIIVWHGEAGPGGSGTARQPYLSTSQSNWPQRYSFLRRDPEIGTRCGVGHGLQPPVDVACVVRVLPAMRWQPPPLLKV